MHAACGVTSPPVDVLPMPVSGVLQLPHSRRRGVERRQRVR
jgi:hypothetical protein